MEKRRGEYLRTYVAIHTMGLVALVLAFSPEVREAAWNRAKGKCEDCWEPLKPGNKKLHHVFPQHMGPNDSLENSAYLCLACERERHKKLYEEFGSRHDYCASLPPRPKGSCKAGKNKRR